MAEFRGIDGQRMDAQGLREDAKITVGPVLNIFVQRVPLDVQEESTQSAEEVLHDVEEATALVRQALSPRGPKNA